MKVVHVQKVTGIGGSERHLLALLPGLRELGHDCRMVVLAAGDYDRFVEPMSAAGVPVELLAIGSDLDLSALRALRRVARSLEPQLIHTHLIHGDLYGQLVARSLGVPGLSSMHATHAFLRRPYLRLPVKAAAANARRVIAISRYVRSFILDLGLAPAGKVTVVPYGIRAQEWEVASERRAQARAELGVAPSEVVVGVASRLFPDKGHDFLMDAFDRARSSDDRLRLLIAGDGPLRPELEAQAAGLEGADAIDFVGYVNDIKTFMNATDLMVFPTMPGFGEGFGLAALEAMAAGRPLIATNLDSLPELVVDGTTGLLVEPGDRSDLQRAIERLASDADLRARMGTAARERALSEFSLERMIEATDAIYRDAVRG